MTRASFDLDLTRIEEILPRYAIEGPRYTSYPTAPVWKDSFGVDQFKAELGRAGEGEVAESSAGDGLSLYVHVPFCRSLCHFCACNRVITRQAELPVRYLDTVGREVEAVREAAGSRTASQQHWAAVRLRISHPIRSSSSSTR